MSLFNLFGRASGFLRYVLLFHYLDPASFGVITYALNVGKLARHFMDGGLDNLISRDGARDYNRVPDFYLHGLIIKSCLGVLFFIGAFFYLRYARSIGWRELLIVYVCLAGSAMVSLNGVVRSCFTAIERMEFVFYTNLPSRLTALFLLFFVLWIPLPLVYVAASISSEFFIWFVLLAALSLRFFPIIKRRFSWTMVKYIVLESWPLAVYGFFNVFYMSLDVMMIEYIMGTREDVAPYTYASQLIEGFTLLLTGYLIAIYPALSRYHEQDENAYQRLFQQSVILLTTYTIPLAVLLGFWSHGWMNLIRETPPVTGNVLRVLAVNLILSMLNTLIIIVFTSRNRQRWLVLFTGLAVAVSFTTNWFFIYSFEQIGAAFASLISQLILFVIMSSVARRMFALRFPLKKPLGCALVSVLSGVLTWLIPGLPLLAAPFVYGIFLLFFAWFFGVLTLEEIKAIKRKFLSREK